MQWQTCTNSEAPWTSHPLVRIKEITQVNNMLLHPHMHFVHLVYVASENKKKLRNEPFGLIQSPDLSQISHKKHTGERIGYHVISFHGLYIPSIKGRFAPQMKTVS